MFILWQGGFLLGQNSARELSSKRPNILLAISDDQSFAHTSFAGCSFVQTPAFDQIAREGIYFSHAFVSSPGCAPSRSSILTGRYPWQNEEAGGHQTLFPQKIKVLPDVLEEGGYFVGYTGKGCSPFNWRDSGRSRNPAGNPYNRISYQPDSLPDIGISRIDYSKNFENFLDEKPDASPFFFWFGAFEPHRPFQAGIGQAYGKKLESVEVPAFLPDATEVRGDLLDYAVEIEWFDHHLEKMIEILKEAGEYENTLIIVTSDNGMAFPAAKANGYEYGIHVPLAISWPEAIKEGRRVEELVSLTALCPTLLEVAGIQTHSMSSFSSTSLFPILTETDPERLVEGASAVFASRERHSSSRWNNLGYPMRIIRTANYLFIWNIYPERWPAGAPQMLNPDDPRQRRPLYGLGENGENLEQAFFDIDACPAKDFLIEQHTDSSIFPFFQLAMGKRPAEELYHISKDPFCLNNLANEPDMSETKEALRKQLMQFLRETSDPRIVGPTPDVFENYQRFAPLRPFPKPDWLK
ncbi:MAG: sulfatase-like hydrolase/transferase [Bacteroidota bacterium]